MVCKENIKACFGKSINNVFKLKGFAPAWMELLDIQDRLSRVTFIAWFKKDRHFINLKYFLCVRLKMKC
jgi:hypothetical protein